MSTWLPGRKADGAVEVDGEAALDAAEDAALDALAFAEFAFELVPGRFAAGPVAAEHRFAVGVLDAVDEHFDVVADLELGLAVFAAAEFAQGHAALGLQAHVDHAPCRSRSR